jgi:hypothetical protein
MTRLIDNLLGLFVQTQVAVSLAATIVGCLLAACFWFRHHAIGGPRAELRDLLRGLQKVHDDLAFVSEFASVDQRFRKSRLMQHAWREFDETLLKPANPSDRVVRATVRPHQYVNRESCGLTFPIWHALPNYFVGVGLFFTFFGLVAALHFASDAVGGNVAEATTALANLLAAATLKFGTSIAGLFSSIAFSVLYHRWVKQLDDSFEALCRELERLTVFITP